MLFKVTEPEVTTFLYNKFCPIFIINNSRMGTLTENSWEEILQHECCHLSVYYMQPGWTSLYIVSLDLLSPSVSWHVHHGGVTQPWIAVACGIWHSCWESGVAGRGAVHPLSQFLSHFEVWVIHKNVNSITAFMWLQVSKEDDCQLSSDFCRLWWCIDERGKTFLQNEARNNTATGTSLNEQIFCPCFSITFHNFTLGCSSICNGSTDT